MLLKFNKLLIYISITMMLIIMLGQTSIADSHKTSSKASTMGTEKEISLAGQAATVLELQSAEKESKRIPPNLRDAAKCIMVFPSVFKAGLLVGGTRGQGLASCRHIESKKWGAPVYVNIDAASVGLQAGISKASIILVLLDDKAVKEFLNPDIKLGNKAEISAGPVGRVADLSKQSSVVSYVRTKGLFAGLDLEQTYVYTVKKSTQEVYGKDARLNEILFSRTDIPPRFKVFMQVLKDFAPIPKS